MNTHMPGFTAQKALNEHRAYPQPIASVHAGFRSSESARQFAQNNGSVVPQFGVPCRVLCPICEKYGGDCFRVAGGCICG